MVMKQERISTHGIILTLWGCIALQNRHILLPRMGLMRCWQKFNSRTHLNNNIWTLRFMIVQDQILQLAFLTGLCSPKFYAIPKAWLKLQKYGLFQPFKRIIVLDYQKLVANGTYSFKNVWSVAHIAYSSFVLFMLQVSKISFISL